MYGKVYFLCHDERVRRSIKQQVYREEGTNVIAENLFPVSH
jgi:hypothetical protein